MDNVVVVFFLSFYYDGNWQEREKKEIFNMVQGIVNNKSSRKSKRELLINYVALLRFKAQKKKNQHKRAKLL